MQLINSLFLPLIGAAVLIPVIIHLIWRNKAIRIDFPAMRFLIDNKKPVSRWLRWKQLLLLLLRCLIFAFLALMFARPYFSKAGLLPVWDEIEKEILIIYDNSASMQMAGHQSKAQAHLADVLAKTNEKSRLTLLLAGSSNLTTIESAPATALTKELLLSKIKPGFGFCDLHNAIQLADSYLLAVENRNREIVIISDFQQSNWPRQKGAIKLESKARIVLLPVSSEKALNAAITQIAPPLKPGEVFRAELSLPENVKATKLKLELKLANNTISQSTLNISKNKQSQLVTFPGVPLPLTAQSAGQVAFSLEDDFPTDNHFYFVLNQHAKTRILAINGERANGPADELFYLKSALNLKTEEFDLTESNPIDAGNLPIKSFDIILLANVRGLDQNSLKKIEQLVDKGGSVIFVLGDRLDIELFNKFFVKLAGVNIHGKAFPRQQRFAGEQLLINDSNHLIAQQTFAGQNSAANFYQYWKIQPGKFSKNIFVFSSGNPAVIENAFGNGKSLVFAFPLDSEWSDFPIQSEYLPFVYSIMHYCTMGNQNRSFVRVGDPLTLARGFDPRAKINVTLPDGTVQTEKISSALFLKSDEPGIYSFRQAGRSQQFAVNIDPRESTIRFDNPEAVQAKITTPGEIVADNKIIRAGQFSELDVEMQQKLWRYILLALFFLILFETVFANRVPR